MREALWPERAGLGPGEGCRETQAGGEGRNPVKRGLECRVELLVAESSAGGLWRVGHMGKLESSLSPRCSGGHVGEQLKDIKSEG